MPDNWKDKSTFCCGTCQHFSPKEVTRFEKGKPTQHLGRCRRHAPTMSGFPVVFTDDWCGDHKLGTPPR